MPEQTPVRPAPWWTTMEDYNPGGTAALAQRLHDEGLLVAVNKLALHPAGLALGVRARTHERPRVTVQGIAMFATDDPEGIVYADDGQLEHGIEKLTAAGHTALATRLRIGDAGLLRSFADFLALRPAEPDEGTDVDAYRSQLIDEFLAT
jgi:hypothetical protein